jgi:hypothetical protein
LAETLPGMVSLYSLLKIFPWIQARKIRRPFLWHPTVHKPTESYAESNVLFLGGIIPSLLFPFATMNPIILYNIYIYAITTSELCLYWK